MLVPNFHFFEHADFVRRWAAGDSPDSIP